MSGQDDILVGSPIAGRTHTETEPLIGFFANTLVLRTSFGDNPTFNELLGRVRDCAVGAYGHQEMPLSKIVESLRLPRDPSRNPLFQANFRLQTILPVPLELTGLAVERIEVDPGIARFDIAMELWDYPGSFGGYFEYCSDLFDEADVAELVTLFQDTLSSLTAEPEKPLDSLFSNTATIPSPESELLERVPRGARSVREIRRKAIPLG